MVYFVVRNSMGVMYVDIFQHSLEAVKDGNSDLAGDNLENLGELDIKTLEVLGKSVFEDFLDKSPGLKNEWNGITGFANEDYFIKDFEKYILYGPDFKESNPQEYEFLKDYIFYGEEFNPKDINTSSDSSDSVENAVYGAPLELGKILDYDQGDNDLGFKGTCGLVSCSNILMEAGINISENDIVHFAENNGLCDISDDPNSCGGTTADERAEILTDAGVPSHSDDNSSLEDIAKDVNDGKGVIISVNAGVLWDNPSTYGTGESNHAITVTGYETDDVTGEITGFYICDSGRCEQSDSQRFVPMDQMQEAYDVPGHSAVITDNPIR